MNTVEKFIEVDCPVSTVYNQWTQFEDFPKFMPGVHEVRQLDDARLHWRAQVLGVEKEWDAQIIEQQPDSIIAWRSTSGALNAGTVTFEPRGQDRTMVHLTMKFDPSGPLENVGSALGLFGTKVEVMLDNFKRFIEERGEPTGAWRGSISQNAPE